MRNGLAKNILTIMSPLSNLNPTVLDKEHIMIEHIFDILNDLDEVYRLLQRRSCAMKNLLWLSRGGIVGCQNVGAVNG